MRPIGAASIVAAIKAVVMVVVMMMVPDSRRYDHDPGPVGVMMMVVMMVVLNIDLRQMDVCIR